MRKSRQATEANRERILEQAAVLFRERGLMAVSVADVMTGAGMTHGGFYRHFGSKEQLVAEAIGAAFAERVAAFDLGAGQHGARVELDAFVARYLSLKHVAHPGRGCPIAALGGEIAREGDAARAAFSTGFRQMIARIASGLPAGIRNPKSRASQILIAMAGAVMTARAHSTLASKTRVLADVHKQVAALRTAPHAIAC